MHTKGFLNYFSAIIEFLKVVFRGEIINFLKNCDTFAIKEWRDESTNYGISKE